MEVFARPLLASPFVREKKERKGKGNVRESVDEEKARTVS
jgi:hypothetical protein